MLGVVLVVVGLFGALRFSALLFGLFTTGLFLIFSDLRTKGKNYPPTALPDTTSLTCPNCRIVLEGDVAFCPQCGKKVRWE